MMLVTIRRATARRDRR